MVLEGGVGLPGVEEPGERGVTFLVFSAPAVD